MLYFVLTPCVCVLSPTLCVHCNRTNGWNDSAENKGAGPC